MDTTTISDVTDYCLDLLRKSRCKVLPFHGIKHTLEVFENVRLIGGYENVAEDELEQLKIAGLFHDTGMSETYIGHEAISVENAKTYLGELNYPKESIQQIVKLINATKMPQNPSSLLQRIICDADLFHLASSNYLFKNELLRVEWKTYMDLNFTDEEWYQLNLEFLANHEYHTDFGKTVLAEGRIKNIELMERLKNEASL